MTPFSNFRGWAISMPKGSTAKLGILVATMGVNNPAVTGWSEQDDVRYPVKYWRNDQGKNLGVAGAYHRLYEQSTEEVQLYLHNDVICREPKWDQRLLAEFEDPRVAVVGFGGAVRHGLPDLYKTPYQLQQLQRVGYLSNVDDAEVHGERFTGSREVAVLDGFALAVRRSFLDRVGGWAKISKHANFYCYDYALCALARRYGYKVRVVGVRCHHLGGGTSVQAGGVKQFTSPEAYEKAHAWFANEFRDVMPWSVARVGG